MSRLSSMFMLWLLLLFAAAPASAVMDVQPRNHAWELPASSYDLAPDVRDGPNLYAYVMQNPWSKFDPKGLTGKGLLARLFGKADEIPASVQKINGRNPIHAEWAGQTVKPTMLPDTIKNRDQIIKDYPDGVTYSDKGRANFTPYAKADLKFNPGELTGEMGPDTSAARTKMINDSIIAGKPITMKDAISMEQGHTWHHVEGGQGMQLVPSDLHDAYKHTGGRADIKEGNFFTALFAGFFASRTMEAKANGGDVKTAQNLDAATWLPVIGDGVDVVATGAEYTEKKLNNIVNRPGDTTSLGNMRAQMMREHQAENEENNKP